VRFPWFINNVHLILYIRQVYHVVDVTFYKAHTTVRDHQKITALTSHDVSNRLVGRYQTPHGIQIQKTHFSNRRLHCILVKRIIQTRSRCTSRSRYGRYGRYSRYLHIIKRFSVTLHTTTTTATTATIYTSIDAKRIL